MLIGRFCLIRDMAKESKIPFLLTHSVMKIRVLITF